MLAGTGKSLGQACPHTVVTTNANLNFSLLTGTSVVSAPSCAKMSAGTENSLGQTCPQTIETTDANQDFSPLTIEQEYI